MQTTQYTSGFETVTCSRCGGSGHYSYCQMYGTTCFKCRGRKVVFTKRGAAAFDWYLKALSRPAGELAVGDVIYEEPDFVFHTHKGGFFRITEIAPDTTLYNGEVRPEYLRIQTKVMGHCCPNTQLFRVAHTAEQKAAVKARAMEYQASLTKLGTPRKRKLNALELIVDSIGSSLPNLNHQGE